MSKRKQHAPEFKAKVALEALKGEAIYRFQKPDSWSDLTLEARMALTDDVAGLPSAFEDGALPAKQFDLLCLNSQLRLLQNDGGFSVLQQRIIRFASALEELENVPLVAKELELILDLQSDAFWEAVTVESLESVRKRLRGLAELIKPKERKIVITDFIDEIDEGTNIVMPDIGSGVDKARFKMKVRKFVEAHRDHITLNKVKFGQQLTKQDLDELSAILVSEGVTDQKTLKNLDDDGGLGPFLRSLIGLDRAAAKDAFGGFTTLHRLSADQTEFLDLIIDSLTEGGIVEPAAFYESPFTDIDDQGIAGVFSREQAKTIVAIVRTLNESAAA